MAHVRWQDGDPYPQYADDADVPEGETEVIFRVKAASDIKALGNALYKKVRSPPSVLQDVHTASCIITC